MYVIVWLLFHNITQYLIICDFWHDLFWIIQNLYVIYVNFTIISIRLSVS